MDYTHLGRIGLKVSRLALGTMNFGELTDEATSFSIMDETLDAGINFFDTADVYGGPQLPDREKGFGLSEEIIGRWLAQGRRRGRIVLATKLYQPMDTGPNDRGLSAYHIRRACEPASVENRPHRSLSDAPRRLQGLSPLPASLSTFGRPDAPFRVQTVPVEAEARHIAVR